MKRAELVEFLQWCLPYLSLRWQGLRKVRNQVGKRLRRRLCDLDLADLAGYRAYLASHPDEWPHLDAMCRITISRFYRDRVVFEAISSLVLPDLAAAALERGDRCLAAWSCGCASGEEAYTLAILWHTRVADRFPGMKLEITATDADAHMIERARRGYFTAGSIRELPEDLRRAGTEPGGEGFRVCQRFREQVQRQCQDVRVEAPAGPFDLVLCRNLVLTYFADPLQREVMERVVCTLRPGGGLVIGSHERLPTLDLGCEPWVAKLPIYRWIDGSRATVARVQSSDRVMAARARTSNRWHRRW